MSTSGGLLTVLILFLLQKASKSAQNSSIELTYSNACEICICGPGPSLQPKELAKCENPSGTLKITSLPDFVKGLEILNAKNGVIFMRGVIRVRRQTFRVSIKKASTVDFQEKSTTIIDSKGQVAFDLESIGHMKMRSRSISSSSGSFELKVTKSELVDIEGQAFDIITKIKLIDVKTLNLAPAAFKPNVMQMSYQQPSTSFELINIGNIPTLPMEVFSSARTILFRNCRISDIESSAFSGVWVHNVTFEASHIDRIHTSSFPDRALIENLAFVKSELTSVSEKAVVSAISKLKISGTNFSSISTEALNIHVAKVEVDKCIFKTLVERSFHLKSWNEVKFESNDFKFLEKNAFLGIAEPKTPSSFYFTGNKIQFANRNALKLDNMANSAKNVTSNNIFQKDCECDFDKWLMAVSGENDFKNPSDWAIALLNTSHCQVPLFAEGCFNGLKNVLLGQYSDKMCNLMASNQDCSYISPWEIIRDQIEVDTNKGILLLLLMFVLASTLIVGIVTLLRWIIYTIQARKFNNGAEWSFTKIEEQQKLKEAIEEEAIELEESPSPTQHYESLAIATTESPLPKIEEKVVVVEQEPLLDVKLPEHASEGKPPGSTTFYDEMICLLQEKLEDPENYSTVVDDKENTNATFYMDPMNLKKN